MGVVKKINHRDHREKIETKKSAFLPLTFGERIEVRGGILNSDSCLLTSVFLQHLY